MKSKINTKEIGLDLGLLLFKNFLDTDYMHYGYFKNNLEAKIINLPKAQEYYSDLLLSNIPDNVKSILEVGCGSGRFAYNLCKQGYRVDCVTPQSALTDYAEKLLINKAKIYKNKFENFTTDQTYDLILFSESFQYIKMHHSISKAINMSKPNGHIMIADFFQTNAVGKSALGGGHKFSSWKKILSKTNLETIVEIDITNATAPTIEIANQLSKKLALPIWDLIMDGISFRYPKIYRFLKWKYARKINKIEYTYFSGEMNAENFKKFKKYMFYLLKKK